MAKELISIDEQIAYVNIRHDTISNSKWKEVIKGKKWEYERVGKLRFDKLIISNFIDKKVTYILDSRSKLSYEKMFDHTVYVKGRVYNRQPLR